MLQFAERWADSLLNTSSQAGLACLVLWGVIRLFPKMPVLLRVWLWRGVAIKFLLGLVAIFPIGSGVAGASAVSSKLPGSLLFLLIGSVGTFVAYGVSLTVCAVKLRTLLHSSKLCTDAETRSQVCEIAKMLGLKRAPCIRLSSTASVPMLVGTGNLTLVLPESLSPENAEFHPAIAHELSHAKHRDLTWNWIAACAEAVFFFHPCFWLLKRELYFSQELACDLKAISATSITKADYSRMLISLPNTPQGFEPAMVASLASAYPALKRRITQLHRGEHPWRGMAWIVSILAVVTMMPTWSLGSKPALTPKPSASAMGVRVGAPFAPAAAGPVKVRTKQMEVK